MFRMQLFWHHVRTITRSTLDIFLLVIEREAATIHKYNVKFYLFINFKIFCENTVCFTMGCHVNHCELICTPSFLFKLFTNTKKN